MLSVRSSCHQIHALLIVYSAFSTRINPVPIRIIPREVAEDPSQQFRPPNPALGPYASISPQCLHLDTVFEDKNAKLTVCSYEKATLQVLDKDDPTTYTLGIYRGWSIEPLYLRYKTMIFDDGSQCPEDGDILMQLEFEIIHTNKSLSNQLIDFRVIGTCHYRVSLYMKDSNIFEASAGMMAPGAVSISSTKETLAKACGEEICEYSFFSERIEGIQDALEKIKGVIQVEGHEMESTVAGATISASEKIITTASNVLTEALRLLKKLEEVSKNVNGNPIQDQLTHSNVK
uniref:Uncharacterized protein AlNc14C5G732 n=1 Tax=Albugo laibachii Nc14 TaxID=890382 RepID=F0W0U7_9STRA|nr:conserved hypothetical protein [Albugo laibachii Nc14]|eukprot:CCA14671.1 conserved hypothetical protein [Albugo laibachii Nc14]